LRHSRARLGNSLRPSCLKLAQRVLFSSGVPSAISIPVILEPGKLAAQGKLAVPVKAGALPNGQPGQVLESPEASFRANLQTIFEAASEDFHAAGLALKDVSVAPEQREIQGRSDLDGAQPIHARPARRFPGIVLSSQPPANGRLPVELPQPVAATSAPPAPSPASNSPAALTRRATAERSSHSVLRPHRISPSQETGTSGALPQISAVAVPAPVSQVAAPESHRPETAAPGPVRTADLIEELHAPPAPAPVEGHPSLAAIPAGSASSLSVAEPAEHSLLTHSAGPDSIRGNKTEPAEHFLFTHSAGPASVRGNAEQSLLTHSAGPASLSGNKAEADPGETQPGKPGRVTAPGSNPQWEGYSSSASPSPLAASPAVPVATVRPAHAVSSQQAHTPAPMRAPSAGNGTDHPSAPAHAVVETATAEAKSVQAASSSSKSRPARVPPVERAATASSPAALQPAAPPVHGAPISPRREFVNPASPAVPAQSDTFAALDEAPPAPPATWVHAGANRAEAGYLDPTLGWVVVRAEAPGNLLHASIMPSTPEAAQVLGTHLAGLNTYLADHRGAAAQLTIASPDSGQAPSGHSGFDTSGRQPEQQQGDAHSAAAIVNHPVAPREADTSLAWPGAGFETLAPPSWSGGHISVIA